NKDLRQSAALLAHYRQGSGWEAREAWGDLVSRGPGWKTRALRGLSAVEKLAPELGVQDWLDSAGKRCGDSGRHAKPQEKRAASCGPFRCRPSTLRLRRYAQGER